MAAYPLTDAQFDALTAAIWRAMEERICTCTLGRPCAKLRAFEQTLASVLGSTATNGRPTLAWWLVWRDAPFVFRAAREPLEE